MKALNIYGRILISLSMLLWATFQFTKDSWHWPSFVGDNILYITLFFTAIGYVILWNYYRRAKKPNKARELVIIAVVIFFFFLVIQLFSK